MRSAGPAGDPDAKEEQGDELTLDELVALVRQARDDDRDLAEQLSPFLEQLAVQENVPHEIQALARVLLQLLAGETSPNLSGLPPELVEAVGEAFDLPEP